MQLVTHQVQYYGGGEGGEPSRVSLRCFGQCMFHMNNLPKENIYSVINLNLESKLVIQQNHKYWI